jgi:two-component sensor histidine kinase
LGLVPDFEVSKGNSFGMRLVKALAKQTHGQFCLERHPRGSEFILDIPIDVTAR